MNIICKLTLRHLKLNKKRTLITILGVMISVAMITAVSICIESGIDMLKRDEIDRSGDWHINYHNITKQNIEQITSSESHKQVIPVQNIGYAILDGMEDGTKPYVYVRSVDKTFFDNMSLKLKNGRYPQNSSEIVVGEDTLSTNTQEYEIGDKIKLNIGNRYIEEMGNGRLLNQTDIFTEGEKIVSSIGEVEYTIVGITKRHGFDNYEEPGAVMYTYTDGDNKISDDFDLIVTLEEVYKGVYDNEAEKLKKIFKDNGQEYSSAGIDFNRGLLRLSNATGDDQVNSMISVMYIIFMSIIMLCSVSLIYNAFEISVSERGKYLGMLASVGATKRQKRLSVFFEGFLVGIVSIPLGIISGFGGMAVTFKLINPMIFTITENDIGLKVTISWESILAAVIFSIITILLSMYLPARRASKISPIDAIRQSQDVKLTGKKIKTSKLTRKIFGFEAELGIKNLKRNRRRYRATVIVLIISIILFLSTSYYTYSIQKSFGLLADEENYDGCIYSEEEIDVNTLERLKQFDSFKNMVKTNTMTFQLVSPSIYDIATDKFEEYLKDGNYVYGDDASYEVRIVAYENDYFREYTKKIGLSDKEIDGDYGVSGVFINKMALRNNMKVSEIVPTKLVRGDEIEVDSFEDTKISSIHIIDVTDELPLGLKYISYPTTFTIVVSFDSYEQLKKEYEEGLENNRIFVKSDSPENINEDMKKYLEQNADSELSIYIPYEEDQKSIRMVMIISVFMYGFIALISLICVANMFNTMSTSIQLRRREFAMLLSVGMDKKAFNKMIVYESLLYGTKALIWGIPLSVIIMKFLHTSMSEAYDYQFEIIWDKIAFIVVLVIIVVGASMLYSTKKIRKYNIVDALKEENI